MSELVQTLWFEDTSFLHEQMLDTPVGRFSIRQMSIFLIFSLISWLSSLLFMDAVLKIVVAGAVFFAGAALFTRKIKTVPPETHLLHLTKQLTTKTKQNKPVKNTQPIKPTLQLSAVLGVPVKLVGVLKDFTGKVLADKGFKVNINSTPYSKGTTDEEGNFCAYFAPDRFGIFQIEIQPENSTEPTQQITVNVNPKNEEEVK